MKEDYIFGILSLVLPALVVAIYYRRIIFTRLCMRFPLLMQARMLFRARQGD